MRKVKYLTSQPFSEWPVDFPYVFVIRHSDFLRHSSFGIRHLCFGLLSSFVLRPSSFDLRHSSFARVAHVFFQDLQRLPRPGGAVAASLPAFLSASSQIRCRARLIAAPAQRSAQ